MKIRPFELERYFAQYEFLSPYLLSCSDCEALKMTDLLDWADEESLKLWRDLKMSYTESQGLSLLRQEVSLLYKHISPEQVLVLVPEEGIFIAMNVLLRPGDHIISTFPGYQSLYEIANSIGCEVDRWYPDRDYQFRIEALFEKVRENTRLIVINFPHNPTGSLPDPEIFIELVEFVKQKGIFLFSDEMFRYLEYEKKQRLPSGSDIYDNCISLSGMSKTFALPGLRIGWLTTRNLELMEKLQQFKDYTSICNSAPGEILALIGLQNKDRIIRRNLDIISRNMGLLDPFMAKHDHIFRWIEPKAGSVAFPEFLLDTAVENFCKDLMESKGVMLLPSTVFSCEKPAVRFGLGRKHLPEALGQLEEYLRVNYG